MEKKTGKIRKALAYTGFIGLSLFLWIVYIGVLFAFRPIGGPNYPAEELAVLMDRTQIRYWVNFVDVSLTIVCTVCMVLLMLKFVSKRRKNPKLDMILLPGHKKVGITLFVASACHMATSLTRTDHTALGAYIFGFVLLAAVGFTCYCAMEKEKFGGKWVLWHRVGSGTTLFLALIHPFFR